MNGDISALRNEYSRSVLDESHVDPNPVKQFDTWFDEALKAEVPEANAMTLSTVSPNGIPSGRVLLLKGITANGFVFYTNYQSAKGQDLQHSGLAAMTFFWPQLERQVRVQGHVSKVTRDQSEEYFHSRPKSSQIGAWVSPQSTVIKDRSILEERQRTLEEKFKNEEVLPLPKQWGGYILEPFLLEFWQGRPSRLHDRIVYTRVDKEWKICRLAP